MTPLSITPSQSSSTPLQVSVADGRTPALTHTATPDEQSVTPMAQATPDDGVQGAPAAQGTQLAIESQTLGAPGSQRIELPAEAVPAMLKLTWSAVGPASCWMPMVALSPVARGPPSIWLYRMSMAWLPSERPISKVRCSLALGGPPVKK